MSGNPSIVVRIAANVREFLSGTDQVENALTDLGNESGDLARDVERDTDRMVDAFRDAGRKIDTSTAKAGRDVKGNLGASGKEAGKEAAANIAEGIGSGTVDIKDAFLGTLGGLATALGPVASGLTLAGGAAVALVLGGMEKEKEKAKVAGSAFFDAYRDGLIEASERESLLTAALGVDDYQEALIKAQGIADDLGVDVKQVVSAFTTGKTTTTLDAALARAADAVDRANTGMAGKYGVPNQTKEAAKGAKDYADAAERAADALERANRALETQAALDAKRKPAPYGAGQGGTISRPGGGIRP